jgi:glycosyltransferase involved in cell wall biosynthesis
MPVGAIKSRVCILTSVHQPFDVRIFHKEARSLTSAGYEVVIVAPHTRSEQVDGIRVMAVPLPKGRRERMTKVAWRVLREAVRENASIYHFHDPELIPVGLLLKCRGKRVIYDVHEDFPQSILNTDRHWVPPRLRHLASKVVEWAEASGALVFDAIVAATPSIARRFPKHKTTLVQNFPLREEFVSESQRVYDKREPLVVYVGVVSAARGAREMIRAISVLPNCLGTRLVIAGNVYPTELRHELAAISAGMKVEFLGWRPRRDIADLLARSRIGLVLFHPIPNHTEAQPNKLFEYMAQGIPLIASDFPLWRRIVGQANCGLLVDPLDPQAIAKAIESLLRNKDEAETMGQRGLLAARSLYNWDNEARNLVKTYAELST